ncbi:hypothetical protein KQI84_00130 [bacterium]|nr:hypothetical protein [bacterium]
MNKRDWTLSIALLAFLLLAPVWALAEVTITVGEGAGNPGHDITLSITFSGAEEPGIISAFSVFLDFDPRLLDVPKGSTQPTNPVAGIGAEQPNVTILSRISSEEDPNRKDKLEISGVIISGPDIANGEIATLTFTIPGDLPDGYYEVAVTDTEVRDNLNVEVPSTSVPGTLTIGTPPIPTPSPTPSDTPTQSPTPVTGAIVSTMNVVGDPYAASGSYTVDIAVSNNTEDPVAAYALRVYYDPASTEPTGITDASNDGMPPRFRDGGQPQTDAQGTFKRFAALGSFDATQNNLTLCTITFTNTASPAPSHNLVVAPDPPDVPLISVLIAPLTVAAYDSTLTDPFVSWVTPTPSETPSPTPSYTPTATPTDVPTSTPSPTPSPTPVAGAIVSTTNVVGDPYAASGSYAVDIAVSNNIEGPVASYALRIYYDPASTEPTGITDVDLGGVRPSFGNFGVPQTDAQGTYKNLFTMGNLDATQNNLTLCTLTFTNTASPAPNHSVLVAADDGNVPLISVSFYPLTVGAYDNTSTDPLPGGATPTPTPTPRGSQGWYFW